MFKFLKEKRKKDLNKVTTDKAEQNVKEKTLKEHKKSKELPKKEAFIKEMAKKLQGTEEFSANLYKENKVKRGLRNDNGTGVVVGLTRIGEVLGYTTNENKEKIPCEGKLYYRGYDVEDLADNFLKENRFGFEEVTYLLIFGELPTKKQLAEFKELLGERRELPYGFARDSILTAPSNNIMNKLARSVLTLYSYDEKPDDTSIENVIRQSIDLIGYFPAIIAYAYQARQTFFFNESLHLHYPIADKSTAENILRMVRSTGEYTELEAKLLDLCLVLHAEHGGGNNSTFTTHLVSSSGTDTYSAVAAAVGSLKGPKHGGANIAVLNMIDDLKKSVKDISNYSQVEEYLIKILKKEANDKSGLIYGMGHAIYTLSDPRAKMLKELARQLARSKDKMEDFLLCDFIETKTPQLQRQILGLEKPICANVDLYSGFVYDALEIPTTIATPLFATARLSGWCAHRIEELTLGKKIMRPAYNCVEDHKQYVKIDER